MCQDQLFTLLGELAKSAPVVVVLWLGVKYLYKAYCQKDQEVREITKQFREDALANLDTLKTVSTSMNEIADNLSSLSVETRSGFELLRQEISKPHEGKNQ